MLCVADSPSNQSNFICWHSIISPDPDWRLLASKAKVVPQIPTDAHQPTMTIAEPKRSIVPNVAREINAYAICWYRGQSCGGTVE